MREVDQSAGCFVTLTFDTFTVTARGENMAYTLPADKQIKMKVSYVDANGNPAIVDGDVSWASSNTAIINAVVNPSNTFEAVVRPGTQIGQAQVTATADADLGSGVRQLVTLMDVTVVGGEAVAGVIEPVGDPEPIPSSKK